MKMQKSRPVQYLCPDSPPSVMKKSPLAMLVETCSNIGQELSRSTKSMDTSSSLQNESRKNRVNTSPTQTSKPTTPKSAGSSPSNQHKTLPSSVSKAMPTPNVYGGSNLMNLASQYQLMYQQLLYQAELEQLRVKELAAQQKALSSLATKSLELGNKQLCPICSLTPGYNGFCIHDELSLNPLLAMFNPSLAYPSKINDTSLPSMLTQKKSIKECSLSPPLAHDNKKSYTASSRNTESLSPSRSVSGSDQIKPIDLQLHTANVSKMTQAIKECHWVGSDGYCGQRFTSQEDLMEHLKVHVSTNSSDSSSKDLINKSISRIRYQPYSFTDRSIVPLRH